MKLTGTRQVTQKVTFEVPNYFSRNHEGGTIRDKIVDMFIEGRGTRQNGRDVRVDLFADDADVVQGAIDTLRESYALADKVLQVLADNDVILPSDNFPTAADSVVEFSTLDRG